MRPRPGSTPGHRRAGARRTSPGLSRREGAALRELDRIRAPLFRELERLLRDPDYHRGEEPHACCTRAKNQMRISPLEAKAIARALLEVPELRAKLPAVLRRLKVELPRLEDNTRRQSFDCPLLEGTRCLVHDAAKPIGCTAWHPGRELTDAGWEAFARRDELNDRLHGSRWKLRVIPLWLKRALAAELRGEPRGSPEREARSRGTGPGPRGARLPCSAPSP
ncbi:MAG: hypothetical protein HY721_26000 [Planctomycetes bacterium]|nr:hypothetical protein [Planctomycetota bacterium]